MAISKKSGLHIFIGILITIIAASAMLLKFSPMETLEDKLFDFRFKIRGSIKPPDNIVIAAIDEKSIEKLGRWPWDRDRLALLVKRLSEAGAEIIAFDIILSEREKNDELLSQAINEAGNVILPVVFDFDRDMAAPDAEFLNKSAFTTISNQEMFGKYPPIMAKRVLLPVSELIKNVMALGHINMFPDNDGTMRWESLIIGYRDSLFPSITLQTAAAFLGVPGDKIELKATEGIRLGKRYIPTDRWGRTLINYFGAEQTFRHVPISDILDKSVKPELLQGKIVLVGATAVGIYDLRVTPFSPAMPGVEKHASVIASILGNNFLRKAPMAVNLAVLLISGLIFSVLVTRFKAIGAAGITGLSIFLILLSGYYLFALKGIWINIAYPSGTIFFIFISVTAYNYAIEERFSREIRAMFSTYVTERVVNELIKNPDMAKIGGDRRELTILFSDVRGFTTFSEKHTPEEVIKILNEYLGAMTEIVFKWEGTLDKFIGDAILAFWGAPLKQEDHAELAVKCAFEMISRLHELQKKWESEGKEGLDIGIGINTGEVIVGNIGTEGKKMDYTVIGDHVNLGSRIESLTRKYNANILITEFTLENIRAAIKTGALGHIHVKGLEKVIVKGKDQPVGIFEILSLDHDTPSVITECDEDKVVRHKEK